MMTDFISRLKELRGKVHESSWTPQNSIHPNENMKSIWTASGKFRGIEIADSLSPENAQLICELRNSLDLWLELAEAVEELTKANEEHWFERISYAHPGWDKIEKALAKLRGMAITDEKGESGE